METVPATIFRADVDGRLAIALAGFPLVFVVVATALDFAKARHPLGRGYEPIWSHRTPGSAARYNERWSFLDNAVGALLFIQILVGLWAFGFVASEHHHFGDAMFGLLTLGIWSSVWIIAFGWLRLVVRPSSDPTVGHGLLPFFILCFAAKAFELQSLPADANVLLKGAESAETFAMIFLVFTEAAQRHWQSVRLIPTNDDTEVGADKPKVVSPEFAKETSVWSRLTFAWIEPMLIYGYSKSLEDEDVWQLDPRDSSEVVVRKFKVTEAKSKSLQSALFRHYFWVILFVSSLAVVQNILAFNSPYFLNRLVFFLQQPDREDGDLTPYLLLIGLFVCSIISSLLLGVTFHYARRLSLNIRTALISEIYEKALRRAAGIGAQKDKREGMFERGDEKASIGKIVTLMSSDTERVCNVLSQTPFLVIGIPISCTISICGLLYLMGPSALAGISIILVSGPLTGTISSFMVKTQIAFSSATDKRTSMMNEALQGIRVIKYFGWEPEFIKRITVAREAELGKIKQLWGYWLGFYCLSFGTSIMVIFISFFFYSYVFGNVLDAATAFTSIYFLRSLSMNLGFLPMIAMQIMRAKVALDRVADFLKEEELEKYQKESRFEVEKPSETTPLLANMATSSSTEDEKPKIPSTIGFDHGRFIYFGTEDKQAAAPAALEAAAAAAATSSSSSSSAKPSWFSRFFKNKKGKDSATGTDGSSTPQLNFALRDITVQFPMNQLTAVVGPTGSGKTSLLLSLIGEMKRLEGSAILPDPRTVPGGIAFVSQTAFLLNATIRDNILFGQPYDEERYRNTIEACALMRDLETLDGGDLTEIGEKGINLSGGQKQRISLARAVYSPSSIVLLDDVLSAVDAPTAKYLVKHAILGKLMEGRTRILVTHATSLVLPVADYVVAVKNGEIAGAGTVSELVRNPVEGFSLGSGSEVDLFNASKDDDADSVYSMATDFKGIAKEGTKIVDEEQRSRGVVKVATYAIYFFACGGLFFLSIFFVFFVAATVTSTARNVWVKIWVETIGEQQKHRNETDPAFAVLTSGAAVLVNHLYHASASAPAMFAELPQQLFSGWAKQLAAPTAFSALEDAPVGANPVEHGTTYFVGIYALISFGTLVSGILEELWMLYGSLIAARKLHKEILDSVFGSPVKFFEKTPIGRILNRFTKDIGTIDNDCMNAVEGFLSLGAEIIAAVGVIIFGAPVIFLFFVPIVYVFLWISSLYFSTSREIKRLNSVSNSPIYAQFSETLTGVSVIRSYGGEKRSLKVMMDKVDRNTRFTFFLWVSNRWLNLRCEATAAVFIFATGTCIVASNLGAAWAGLALTYAFQITNYLTWVIRSHAELDMSMNAVERVQEYSILEQEPPAIVEDNRPPTNWPHAGAVEVKNLSIQYTPETPIVLHDLTFSIKKYEKIGVVGRTGAGKSTLSLAFFRILPFTEGSITIDGIDISTIGLRDLRQRLTIIPQDPVLFEGTLRSNIDPMSTSTDEEVWEAIRSVGLLDSLQQPQEASVTEEATAGRKELVEEVEEEITTVITTTTTTNADGTVTVTTSEVEEPVKQTVIGVEEVTVGSSSSGTATVAGAETASTGVQNGVSLEQVVEEGGQNFSLGQRQLICMARALLRKSRLIFLDEATASVDEATDAKIQETIRTALKEGSVITIAHRLKTIIDYDRVLVLDQGKIVEYDSPYSLLTTGGIGHFKKMCEETGEFDELVQIAKTKAGL
ncbi:hypothetical protein HK101_011982 [Irineochytrium annulatum]|nr:hypothetical protein HK101_011982 [Irineochytrium annulatum]